MPEWRMTAVRFDVAPGACYLRGYLPLDQQRAVSALCFALGAADPGFYTPIVRGGHPMSVQMLCLGRHWNALTYRYEPVRSDIDQRPVPALPSELASLACAIASAAGFAMSPDIAIVNWYTAGSKMGLHQDKDEIVSLHTGAPVVSISIGDTAKFLFGGLKRRDPVETMLLESGDAFVFGGPARLRYHGVSRILTGTAPPGLSFEGRLNLTIRQY